MVDPKKKGVLLYTVINSPTWWEWQVQDYSPFCCFRLWHWIQGGLGQQDIPKWVMIKRTQGSPKLTFSGNISVDGLREVPGTPVVSRGGCLLYYPFKTNGETELEEINCLLIRESPSQLPHRVNIDGWLDRNSTTLEVRQTRAFNNWMELDIPLQKNFEPDVAGPDRWGTSVRMAASRAEPPIASWSPWQRHRSPVCTSCLAPITYIMWQNATIATSHWLPPWASRYSSP